MNGLNVLVSSNSTSSELTTNETVQSVLLTVPQVARLLKITNYEARRLVRSGVLDVVKLSGSSVDRVAVTINDEILDLR